eukprot:Gb_41581 [translate_table: standard]
MKARGFPLLNVSCRGTSHIIILRTNQSSSYCVCCSVGIFAIINSVHAYKNQHIHGVEIFFDYLDISPHAECSKMMLKRTASHFPCYWKALLRLHSTVSALKRQGNAMAVQSRALCGQFPLLGRLSSRDRLYETRLRGLHWVNISHIGNLWAGKAPASCWGQINRSIKTLAMQSGRISPGEQSVDAAFDPHVNSETWNVNTLEADGDGSATLRDDLGRLTRGSPFLRQDTQVQPEKLIVAVDIDEGILGRRVLSDDDVQYNVLGSFLFALNTFIAERYFLNHRVSEYHVYDFNKVCNFSTLLFIFGSVPLQKDMYQQQGYNDRFDCDLLDHTFLVLTGCLLYIILHLGTEKTVYGSSSRNCFEHLVEAWTSMSSQILDELQLIPRHGINPVCGSSANYFVCMNQWCRSDYAMQLVQAVELPLIQLAMLSRVVSLWIGGPTAIYLTWVCVSPTIQGRRVCPKEAGDKSFSPGFGSQSPIRAPPDVPSGVSTHAP